MCSVCWSLDLRQGWALGLSFGNVRTIGKSEDVTFSTTEMKGGVQSSNFSLLNLTPLNLKTSSPSSLMVKNLT
jgi:hypothetical protein